MDDLSDEKKCALKVCGAEPKKVGDFGSENRGTPSHHPFLDGIFHEITIHFGDPPNLGNPP